MIFPKFVSTFLGLTAVQKRDQDFQRRAPDILSPQSSYLSQLSEVQEDLLSIIPLSVFEFYTRTDLTQQDIIDFAEDLGDQPWFTTLSEYYTQSKFLSLLEHTTDEWYRSIIDDYGAGPLDEFTFVNAIETAVASENDDDDDDVESASTTGTTVSSTRTGTSSSSSGSSSSSDTSTGLASASAQTESSSESSSSADGAMRQAASSFIALAGSLALLLL